MSCVTNCLVKNCLVKNCLVTNCLVSNGLVTNCPVRNCLVTECQHKEILYQNPQTNRESIEKLINNFVNLISRSCKSDGL